MRFILHGTICKKCICTKKTREWTLRESEFEKRAGFVIIAAYCMADKNADNEVFTQLLPLINRAAIDDRLYVKKTVNWALRNIGKRNCELNVEAILVATRFTLFESKSAKWIGSNALIELGKSTLNILDYPRSVYRNNG